LSEFQVVAEWFHVERRSLIPVNEHNQLFLIIFITRNSSFVAGFAHFDHRIMLLEGIDKERVFSCGGWSFFNDQAVNTMVL
jgi:hypothetical protein